MKTLRVLITEECNLSCEYCCNKLPDVRKRFTEKSWDDVLGDLQTKKYHTVCLTGGEPLLNPHIKTMLMQLDQFHPIEIYLHTNGLLLSTIWGEIPVLTGINIGIHYKEQMRQILEDYFDILGEPVTLYVEDVHREEYLPNIPDKLIKLWTRNDCFNNVDKEDWVILREN